MMTHIEASAKLLDHDQEQVLTYLDQFYLDDQAVLTALGLSFDELNALLDQQILPAPSYVVRVQRLSSVVFGDLIAMPISDTRYFHRGLLPEMQRRALMAQRLGVAVALAEIEQSFRDECEQALRAWHMSTDDQHWPLHDCFDKDGGVILEGLQKRLDDFWRYYQQGVFGLCVRNPASMKAIVEKELLQEQLQLSHSLLASTSTRGCASTNEQSLEREKLGLLVDRYDLACMPFTHLEMPRSSRWRLVDQWHAGES